MLIGILGVILIALSWLPETIKVWKEKRSTIDLKFGFMYVTGSLLLIIYSYQVKDYIFLSLNIFALATSSLTLYMSLKKINLKK